jgi:hypothetical protein
MRQIFFWGNDPWGERRKAAGNLIDRLSVTDRVAIIDFDDVAQVAYPLSFLSSKSVRAAARNAVDQIDNSGGTNLSAGLDASIAELTSKRANGRPQFIIFLTDGQGDYSASSAERAREAGITINTIGLGQDVSSELLQEIAATTGGKYYPVERAADLTALFERIVVESGVMTDEVKVRSGPESDSTASPLTLLLLRIASWAVMGLLIGLGQGVRENTREDLLACSLGGVLGGALGGALFDPLVNLFADGQGTAGRALADLVVGDCIGGSMRFAQERFVEASGKPPTTLIGALPKRSSLSFEAPREAAPRRPTAPTPAPVSTRPSNPLPSSTSAPAPLRPAPLPEVQPSISSALASSVKPPISAFEAGNDRDRAIVLAYRSGHYSLRELGAHFDLPATAVKRIISEQG